MTEAEALRIALEVASDAIDVEAHWQMEIHYRGMPDDERAMVDRHLEAISAELYGRARRGDQVGAQAPASPERQAPIADRRP